MFRALIEFTVLKTKVYISPLFFALLTAFLLIDKNGIAGLAVLFSFLHEVSHFLALLCVKSAPKEIRITFFGIQLFLHDNLSTAKKCTVLMAGFMVNFVLAAVIFSVGKPIPALINLFIGIITAVPLASTDGGGVLYDVLEEFSPEKCGRIFKIISSVFLFVISSILAASAFAANNFFIFIAVFYMFAMAIKTAAE